MNDRNSELKAIRDHITRYLIAREEWERWAHRDYEAALTVGRRKESMASIELAFRQLATEFFDESAESHLQPVAFGEPPSVRARSTRVASISLPGPDIAIVSTIEKSTDPDGVQAYEYELRRSDGRWGLVDRRVRDSRGRWIRNLL